MATDTTPKDTGLGTQLSNVFMIFGALIVLMVHLGMYFFSKDVFNIVLSIYIIAFAIIFLVFLQKKKQYTTSNEYTVLSYISFFVISLELIVLVISFIGVFHQGNKYSYKGSNVRYNTYYR